MRRLLIISSSTVFRGAEQVMVDTLPHLAGPRIRILSAFDSPQLCRAVREIPNVEYASTRRMGNWGAGHGGGYWPKLRKLLNYVLGAWRIWRESRSADLVLGNNSGDVIYSIFARLAGRHFVLHCHDDNLSAEHAAMVRIFAPFVTRYIAVSQSTAVMLGALLREPKVDIIPNGLSDLPARPPEPVPGQIRLCWIGAIEERKDPLAFLDLVDRLQHGGLQVQASMVFRESDPVLLGELKRRAKASKAKVDLLGPTERDKIHVLIGGHDWLVVTSRSDPLPTVVLEAYRAGRPVVAKDIPSLRAMVRDESTGLLYRNTSRQDLDAVVRRIAEFDYTSGCGAARFEFDTVYSLNSKVERMINTLERAKEGR